MYSYIPETKKTIELFDVAEPLSYKLYQPVNSDLRPIPIQKNIIGDGFRTSKYKVFETIKPKFIETDYDEFFQLKPESESTSKEKITDFQKEIDRKQKEFTDGALKFSITKNEQDFYQDKIKELVLNHLEIKENLCSKLNHVLEKFLFTREEIEKKLLEFNKEFHKKYDVDLKIDDLTLNVEKLELSKLNLQQNYFANFSHYYQQTNFMYDYEQQKLEKQQYEINIKKIEQARKEVKVILYLDPLRKQGEANQITHFIEECTSRYSFEKNKEDSKEISDEDIKTYVQKLVDAINTCTTINTCVKDVIREELKEKKFKEYILTLFRNDNISIPFKIDLNDEYKEKLSQQIKDSVFDKL